MRLGIERRDQVDHATQRRVVIKQCEAAEIAPPALLEWRLRVGAEQLVAGVTPKLPGELGIVERADLGVQLGDPSPPVPKADAVLEKIGGSGRGFG